MGYKLKTHCKRGHVMDETTTTKKKLSNGYIVRQCKRCRARTDSNRYHGNPKYQAAERHRAKLRWHEQQNARRLRAGRSEPFCCEVDQPRTLRREAHVHCNVVVIGSCSVDPIAGDHPEFTS